MRLGIRTRVTAAAGVAATVAFLACSWCAAASFTADLVVSGGGMTASGKLSVSGKKMRQDRSVGKMNLTTIVRGDKGITWMINPQKKQYMELPGARSLMPTAQDLASHARQKECGDRESQRICVHEIRVFRALSTRTGRHNYAVGFPKAAVHSENRDEQSARPHVDGMQECTREKDQRRRIRTA